MVTITIWIASLLRRKVGRGFVLGVATVFTLASVGTYLSTKATTHLEIAQGPNGNATTFDELPIARIAPTPKPTIAPKVVRKPAPKPASTQTYVAPRPAPVAQAPAPPRPAPAATGTQMKTALVIGINHAAGAQPLQGAVADAKNVRQALINYGFPAGNIQMLLEGQATRSAILAAMRGLAARTSPSGTAVFAVATHSSQTSFRSAEGARVQRSEVAQILGQVRGRLWSVFAICYAGAYNVPGITGPNRLATFGSTANAQTWESTAGSDMVRYLVRDAMLEGKAPTSIESAYHYAYTKMHSYGYGDPVINDQVPGTFVLGPVPK